MNMFKLLFYYFVAYAVGSSPWRRGRIAVSETLRER